MLEIPAAFRIIDTALNPGILDKEPSGYQNQYEAYKAALGPLALINLTTDLAHHWDLRAAQSPTDWGPIDKLDKERLKRILTSKVSGRVLEAMCGFRSYIYNCPGIDEVVALDFSAEALRRYDYPNRTRVLFDLNTLRYGGTIPFFPDGYFNAVCVTFGVNYLKEPYDVFKEFARITDHRGRLLIVGNPALGIRHLENGAFDYRRVINTCRWAGFRNTPNKPSRLPIEMDSERDKYYFIEATKSA